jgi:hypothetical protein
MQFCKLSPVAQRGDEDIALTGEPKQQRLPAGQQDHQK